MCGICGIISSPGGPPPDRDALERMADVLRHRGPDGEGFYLNGSVGLGHRRLSIIDLAGGAQPMVSDDESIVVVFNGEIYNYVELQDDLKRAGHHFRTASDTEVILHGYREYGDRCLDHFNGMFAFALWDNRRRRLLIARDRLGEKPLFYRTLQGGGLGFASELKALLTLPDVPRDVSITALDDYLAYGYVPADRCIIDGVAKLPPGSKLVWENGRVQVERFWNCDDSHRSSGPVLSVEEAVDELDRRLRAAIRIRLRSDVPLGAFLSGGIDSSAVVALASQESAGRLRTFSVGFEEEEFSELRYAGLVASRFGTDHHEIVVRDRDMSILDDIVYHLDEPFADPSALPTYYICREARRHVTVCLSGDGADELFAGYSRYQEAVRTRRLEPLAAVGVRPFWPLMSTVIPRHVRGYGALERLASCGAARYMAQCALFSVADRRRMFTPELSDHVQSEPWAFSRYFSNGSRDLVRAMQQADQSAYLPDDILVKVDRTSMQNSLEVRVPFLDHTLVEFVNGLSTSCKLAGGVGKLVLRRLMQRYLPPEILQRRKMGFGIPVGQWFRGAATSEARDRLLDNSARLGRWFRRDQIERLLVDHRRGGRNFGRKIWGMVILEAWCRRFRI